MRTTFILIAAAMGLGACAPAPVQPDRAALAEAFAASQAAFRAQTLSPTLQYCIRQQAGMGMDRALLTNAGFVATNSATLQKPIAGNIGLPPAPGSAFVVSVNGCTIRVNGFSISRGELSEAIAQDLAQSGFSPTPARDNGALGLPPQAQGFRKGDRVLGVQASVMATNGVPFISVAILAS